MDQFQSVFFSLKVPSYRDLPWDNFKASILGNPGCLLLAYKSL